MHSLLIPDFLPMYNLNNYIIPDIIKDNCMDLYIDAVSENMRIYEELKQREKIYYKSLTTDNFPKLEFPSLKYAVFNFKVTEVFRNKIKAIRRDIAAIKEKINKYKGNKINIEEENKKLDEINIKMTQLEAEDSEDYNYYKEYLITAAKRRDVINNEIAKKVYVETSEEIIKSRIKKLLNQEKNFIIFYDIIFQLNNIINIK